MSIGPGSDPRLLEAAWANEDRLARAHPDAAQARRHRIEDYEAAQARASTGPRRRLADRLARLLRRLD